LWLHLCLPLPVTASSSLSSHSSSPSPWPNQHPVSIVLFHFNRETQPTCQSSIHSLLHNDTPKYSHNPFNPTHPEIQPLHSCNPTLSREVAMLPPPGKSGSLPLAIYECLKEQVGSLADPASMDNIATCRSLPQPCKYRMRLTFQV